MSNGGAAGLAAGALAAVLVYYVPAFHAGLPGPVSDLIAAGVAAIGYFVGGWTSKHKATVTEVQTALNEAEALLALRDGGVAHPPPQHAGIAHAPDS